MAETPNDTQPNPQAYYLGKDAELAAEVSGGLEPAGIELIRFDDIAALKAACSDVSPAVLVLDLALLTAEQTLNQLLNDLVPDQGHPPGLICIAEERGIEWRLQAMRSGAQGFFSAPVPAEGLARKVIQLANTGLGEQRRVLIVEDDPIQSRFFAHMLKSSGMEAQVVANPLKILETMESFRPDLVLMDLYMPGATGAELTAIIREHEDFYDVPIIFLSAEDDLDKQLEALRVGADSFIAKPVHRKALIGTIEHRIRMHRWLRERRTPSSTRREPTAGLVKKKSFLRRLDRVMRDPKVLNQGWGLMVVEVDGPQRMLERLGIAGTERLLRRMGPAIVARLSAEESATRIGDFRHALLARRTDKDGVEALAEELRTSLSELETGEEDEPYGMTVTIGIGSFSPPADDAVTMISRAHKAAGGARRAGGNRIAHWSPSTAAPSGDNADGVIRTLLEKALKGEGFQLNFQPILSLGQADGELYEALLRLRTPDGELIPPSQFLPVAERHGMSQAVDRWVLGQALDVLDKQRERERQIRLLVHQQVSSVAAARWMRWFRDQIVERNLIKLRPLLVFQVEDLRPRAGLAQPLMPELQKLGVEVCATNVTGSADELDLLSNLGIKIVKLPFNRLGHLGKERLADLIGRLRDDGTSVIAAGMEDPDTVALAWSIRPDYIQGNYLQMPSSELSYDFDHGDSEMI